MIPLICPDCKNKIRHKNKKLCCSTCGQNFSSIKGVWRLLPKNLSSFKTSEKQFYSTEFANKKDCSFGYVTENYLKDDWELIRHFKSLTGLSNNARILELGAGNGQYGLILKKRGFKTITITDIAPTGLIAAYDYAKQNNLPYQDSFHAVDAENLPFEDKTFDVIYIVAALHHLENIPKAISEMSRCLKPSGLAIAAIEPNRWYYKIIRPAAKVLKIRRIQKGKSSIADETTKGFTLSELRDYFKEFEVIKEQHVWYLTGIVYYLPELVKRLFNIQLNIPQQIRAITNKIDKFIEVIPLINRFSFHITIIAKKP